MLVWFETFPLALQGQDAPTGDPRRPWRLPRVSRRPDQPVLATDHAGSTRPPRGLGRRVPPRPRHLGTRPSNARAPADLRPDGARRTRRHHRQPGGTARARRHLRGDRGRGRTTVGPGRRRRRRRGPRRPRPRSTARRPRCHGRAQPATGPLSMVSRRPAARLPRRHGGRARPARTGRRRHRSPDDSGSPFLGWSRHGTRVGQLLADAQGAVVLRMGQPSSARRAPSGRASPPCSLPSSRPSTSSPR